ncbi:hypothetical protein X777_04058 [Ooceraea biroi]|uniref:Uncharacterized protein n=1 Tax=Ooceraea biroi TaxID=2015173 RepID=A0A026WJ76_OOCBI|nr:hypothetical protein X777_04058 [Ooceraea biroi]
MPAGNTIIRKMVFSGHPFVSIVPSPGVVLPEHSELIYETQMIVWYRGMALTRQTGASSSQAGKFNNLGESGLLAGS